ncbi:MULTISPECIES: OPT/YSL family transporter [Cupriavidus]|uniref:OPT/YSL family transporter n=1 Tax=Cupriavidus sp. DF5525 TaxID=3160989 RepID=UPI0003B0C616|nr:hypothetical protein N234_18400 [Ralstonia pickettii DTP0602]
MLRVDRIADDISLPELTLRGIIPGALITVVFTPSNIYLGLKVRRGDGVRLPVLAVGIGIYLPPTISSALVVGAMLSWLLLRAERRRATARGDDVKLALEHAERRGTLLASGLIVGESWSA